MTIMVKALKYRGPLGSTKAGKKPSHPIPYQTPSLSDALLLW
jgi:hypothetical protein